MKNPLMVKLQAKLEAALESKGVKPGQAFLVGDTDYCVYYREFKSSDDGIWTLRGMAEMLDHVEALGVKPLNFTWATRQES